MHHVGVWTKDFDRSLEFYQRGLDFTEAYSHDPAPYRAAFLVRGEAFYLELLEDPAFLPQFSASDFTPLTQQPPRGWRPFLTSRGGLFHFAIRTEDTDAAFTKACAHGAKPLIPPMNTEMVSLKGQGVIDTRWCYVEGLNGEWIEFLTFPDLPISSRSP